MRLAGRSACWTRPVTTTGRETYLETFLATQGMSYLDGNFASNEGLMQGLDIDAGVPLRSRFRLQPRSRLHHGILASHYRLTGDEAWLRRVAPKLVAACDFVIRERERTKEYEEGSGGQKPVPEWGLLPAGHLEDNHEWRHWFAVNAHAYGGSNRSPGRWPTSTIPRRAGCSRQRPTTGRISARLPDRAMEEAPVVRLLDGTYVPHVPTRTGIRGREAGWFREAAYGALHLLEAAFSIPAKTK